MASVKTDAEETTPKRAFDSHLHTRGLDEIRSTGCSALLCSSVSPFFSSSRKNGSIEDYARAAARSAVPITRCAAFCHVALIYDRGDRSFVDTPDWISKRTKANAKVVEISSAGEPVGEQGLITNVAPYLFIWNDFAVEQLVPAHKGIKWHRHMDEPRYNYDDPRCIAALAEIRRRRMPIVYEEELHNTVRFTKELAAGIPVIIPHYGMLNGGYEDLLEAGIWGLENVWVDTALASPSDITDYITRYGHTKILFGSDWPFGDPDSELQTVLDLPLTPTETEDVLWNNIVRLHSTSNV